MVGKLIEIEALKEAPQVYQQNRPMPTKIVTNTIPPSLYLNPRGLSTNNKVYYYNQYGNWLSKSVSYEKEYMATLATHHFRWAKGQAKGKSNHKQDVPYHERTTRHMVLNDTFRRRLKMRYKVFHHPEHGPVIKFAHKHAEKVATVLFGMEHVYEYQPSIWTHHSDLEKIREWAQENMPHMWAIPFQSIDKRAHHFRFASKSDLIKFRLSH